MPGLAVGASNDVIGKHGEIIRDDRVVLSVGPITGHGCCHLGSRGRRGGPSREEMRRHAKRRPSLGQPLIERVDRRAVLRRDREMQRIASPKSEHMLIGEPGCRSELSR